MYGFSIETTFDDPALSSNEKFIKKGIALMNAIDIALSFLGPDLEPLEDSLQELGRRHVARRCKPKHWPMMGVAWFHTLEQTLGKKFTTEIQNCWIVMYNFLGYHMIQGLIKHGGPSWDDN
jgi:hemoglobin-like flavoprotein